MNIIDWITKHWMEIVAIVGGIVIAARVIVKLTPTEIDNQYLEKFIAFLKHVGLHIDNEVEEKKDENPSNPSE